jgi:LuxR family maltose regulon positive regulatory protein
MEQLLSTKLYLPSTRPEFVPRPHLIERLNDGLHRKLTLISASAGFGKTSLVADWCRQAEHSITWLSLDQNDNDPVRFFNYLIAALQKLNPKICHAALTILDSPNPFNPEPLLVNLINEINENLGPFFLILEDYHAIETAEIHQAVSFLLDHAPAHMHMTILTRSEPPLPIARLRGQGQLIELHTADLRFRVDEAESFLIDKMDLPLSILDIISLQNRTEGWIVGLQLAALSLQGSEDKAAFIHSFTGSQRFILDYLTEEVLKLQSVEIQNFLLQTSVLERLSGPLCNAVTKRTDSQEILGLLEESNLFVFSLDEERQWYRYHHLFADLLGYHCQRDDHYRVTDLHLRASNWYEQSGMIPDAVSHAIAAEDMERAADLIEWVSWEMMSRGEMRTLLNWLDSLPRELLPSRQQLGVLYVWALALSGQLSSAETFLSNLDDPQVQGEVAALNAYAAIQRENANKAIEYCQQAQILLPENKWFSRSTTAVNLGIAYSRVGNLIEASRTLTEAIQISQAADLKYMTLRAMTTLGQIQKTQGFLRKAIETHRKCIDLTSDQGQQPVPLAGMAFVGLAASLYEINDLEGAMCYAREGIKLQELGGFVAYMLIGYTVLALVYQAQGDTVKALEISQKAEYLTQKHDDPNLEIMLAYLQVKLWIRQGNILAATLWAQEHKLKSIDDLNSTREVEQKSVARALIAGATLQREISNHQVDQALTLLAGLIEIAEVENRMGSMIKLLILQSLAFQIQGYLDLALSSLERSLKLAEPEGYIRAYIDEGKPMERLLRLAQTREISSSYTSQLLGVFRETTSSSPPSTQLVEPLSEREIEVLRLIVNGLSNREIAEELVVAVSTIKTHVNHIYRKLEVNSRTQAVARSQQLDLL